MTFAVKVAGGTGAGARTVKKVEPWLCECVDGGRSRNGNVLVTSIGRRSNPGDRYSCPDCGARRPA